MGKSQVGRTRVVAVISIAAVAALGVAVWIVPAGASNAPDAQAQATLIDTSGASQGVVRFVERGGVVSVTGAVKGLTPGFHGFHVHAGTACTNADGSANFALAAGHLGHDPATGHTHGSHAGDMPSLLVTSDGHAFGHYHSDRFTVADVVGHAVIVHAGPDNLANIPTRYSPPADDTTLATGDSGSRVLCGVVAGN